MTVAELKKKAKELKVKGWWLLTKSELEACVNVKTEEARIEGPVVNTVIPEQMVAATIDLTPPGLLINNRVPEIVPQGKEETVEDYIARGGIVTILPCPDFPAPKITRESSAMKMPIKTEKRTPRRVSKPTLSEQGVTPEKRTPKRRVTASKEELEHLFGSTVTLASLVEASGIEARIARRRLRNSDIEKPGAQWEWPAGHADIAKVKELLK